MICERSEYKRLLAAKNEALKLRAARCKSLENQIEEQRLELQRFRCIVTAEDNLKVGKREQYTNDFAANKFDPFETIVV